MKPVICFGEVLIDFQPVVMAGMSHAQTFQQHAGGAPANVAVAIATLGGKAEFMGMLATDRFADFLLDSLHRANVGTTHVQRTGTAPTALAFVALDAHGERSFSFYRPPAADLLFDADALAIDAFQDASVFHACSNSLTEAPIAQATLACMQRARNAHVLVSFDMNLRPALWPRDIDPAARIWSALALADVVKLSAEELAFLAASKGSEAAALEELWSGKVQLLLITDGAQPLRWQARDARGSLETYSVQAIDSTAAGDAFSGGFLFALAAAGIHPSTLATVTGDRVRFDGMLRFAAACGALATTRRGAFAAMPSRAEVDVLMRAAAIESLEAASS